MNDTTQTKTGYQIVDEAGLLREPFLTEFEQTAIRVQEGGGLVNKDYVTKSLDRAKRDIEAVVDTLPLSDSLKERTGKLIITCIDNNFRHWTWVGATLTPEQAEQIVRRMTMLQMMPARHTSEMVGLK